MGLVLAKHIFVSASGLAFLLPAGFATKKKLPSVAFVFAFSAFHIVMYHVCQIPLLSFIFCGFGNKQLEYFSCYGTVFSIFSTLISLTNYSTEKKWAICTSGGLMAAVRIYHNVNGYGSWSGPLCVACLLLSVSWGKEMWKTKGLYPDKQKWIKFLLPGFAVIVLALILRFVIESHWNYFLVHPVYHILLSVSLTLLLHVVKPGGSGKSISAQDFECGDIGCLSCICC